MMAGFRAPRKRIVLGLISDSSKSDKTYASAYRAARAVAEQVIFIGQHSHRSGASARDVADGRFVRFETVKEAANFLKESAIPDEIILVKGAGKLHLERLMMTFFTSVRCWEDVCGRKGHCPPVRGRGCDLYEVPFEQHKTARQHLVYPLSDKNFG
jgi:UDP-N-acetylmuramoyl-tripeptide--D-alanyl-D-alanine ligase